MRVYKRDDEGLARCDDDRGNYGVCSIVSVTKAGPTPLAPSSLPPACWFFIHHAHFKGQQARPLAVYVLVDGPGLCGPERNEKTGR